MIKLTVLGTTRQVCDWKLWHFCPTFVVHCSLQMVIVTIIYDIYDVDDGDYDDL